MNRDVFDIQRLPKDMFESVILSLRDFKTFYKLSKNPQIRERIERYGLLEKWASAHIGPDPVLRRLVVMTVIHLNPLEERRIIHLPLKTFIAFPQSHVHVDETYTRVSYDQFLASVQEQDFDLKRSIYLADTSDPIEICKLFYDIFKMVNANKGYARGCSSFTPSKIIAPVHIDNMSDVQMARFRLETPRDYLIAETLISHPGRDIIMIQRNNGRREELRYVFMKQGQTGPLGSFFQLWDKLSHGYLLVDDETDQAIQCSMCLIDSSLSPGKASKMLHEGKALTDKQRRFFACRAHGGCGYGEASGELVIDLLNRRTQQASHQALKMLTDMFMEGASITLEFSSCADKDDSAVYPGFKTGYANGSRIHICLDALSDAFNAQHSKTISYDSAHVSHYAAMFLHEFGHVLDKNGIEYDDFYGENTHVERRADAFAQWFINKLK